MGMQGQDRCWVISPSLHQVTATLSPASDHQSIKPTTSSSQYQQVPLPLLLPARRWRTYLRPDVKHPHLEPFTEWEAAVIVQAQRDMGNNWLGEQKQQQQRSAPFSGQHHTTSESCMVSCQQQAVWPLSTWMHDSMQHTPGHSSKRCRMSPYLPRSNRQAPAARAQQHSRQELLALQAQERVRDTHQQVRSTAQRTVLPRVSCNRQAHL
jgi:hypothetical protein